MEDEVDRLLAAWGRERPELDTAPLAILSRVSRLARHLDRARRAVFAEHGLEGFEFDVLTALRRAGAPYELSPGQLVDQTLVSSGTMTNRLDRLQDKKLVRRRRDPADGRGILVRLTAAGTRRIDAAFADLLDRERTLVGGLDDRHRDTLAAALRTVLIPLDDANRPVSPE
jgi:DNA-binding MarR family transcriptional regulator